jgi:hypothetical protein
MMVKSKSQLNILPKNLKMTCCPEDEQQHMSLLLVSAASCHKFHLLLSKNHSKLPHMEKLAHMFEDA